MKQSFWCRTDKLPYLQMLVKRYDGRFEGKHLEYPTGRSYVGLDWEDVSGSDINMFETMKQIIDQKYF